MVCLLDYYTKYKAIIPNFTTGLWVIRRAREETGSHLGTGQPIWLYLVNTTKCSPSRRLRAVGPGEGVCDSVEHYWVH